MKIHTVASNWSRTKVKYKVNIVNATKNNDKRESRNKEAAKNKTEKKNKTQRQKETFAHPMVAVFFPSLHSFLALCVCVLVSVLNWKLKNLQRETRKYSLWNLTSNSTYVCRVYRVGGAQLLTVATAQFFFFANSPNIQYLPPVSCCVSHRFSIFRKIYGDYSSNKSNKRILRSFFIANE